MKCNKSVPLLLSYLSDEMQQIGWPVADSEDHGQCASVRAGATLCLDLGIEECCKLLVFFSCLFAPLLLCAQLNTADVYVSLLRESVEQVSRSWYPLAPGHKLEESIGMF